MIEIILKETKEFLRDISNVFFFLIFPVLLVFLLGNLVSNFAEETIGNVKIHYMVEAGEPADIMAIEGFVQGVADQQNIVFEKTVDMDSSIELVGNDDIAAAILFVGYPMEIQIYEGTDRIKNRTISAMMNGFSQVNKAVNVIAKSNPQALMNSMDDEVDLIIQRDLGIDRTMLDYYAITMIVMISFMSIMLGAMCFMGERQDKTITRLKIAPINQAKLFFSKVLGLLPQIVMQIGIIMLISVLVFGANYASNFQDNLYLFLMFLILTFTVVLVGAVYGLLVNFNPMAIAMPILWTMMFISGTYAKMIFIDGVTQKMPVYQVQEAAFDLAIFGRYDKVNKVILICLVISIIMLIIGGIVFSRKEEQ